MRKKAWISFSATAKLISAFVFATGIAQFLLSLNLNFPASSHLQCLYSSVCVGPVRKPHCWFSHEVAHMLCQLVRSILCKEFHFYIRSMQNILCGRKNETTQFQYDVQLISKLCPFKIYKSQPLLGKQKNRRPCLSMSF